MSTETVKQIKHSGSDWMEKQSIWKNFPPSTLAIKVADVLGQVYLGIYHIEDSVLSKKVNWTNPDEISVTIHGELATFDRPELTVLVFCCLEAGLSVTISGAFNKYTKLTFKPIAMNIDLEQRSHHLAPEWLMKPAEQVAYSYFPNKVICEYNDPYNAAFSISKHFDIDDLIKMVLVAHLAQTRISVQGQSSCSLQLQFTQRRTRKGAMWERHPDIETARSMWEPYYSVLGGDRDD